MHYVCMCVVQRSLSVHPQMLDDNILDARSGIIHNVSGPQKKKSTPMWSQCVSVHIWCFVLCDKILLLNLKWIGQRPNQFSDTLAAQNIQLVYTVCDSGWTNKCTLCGLRTQCDDYHVWCSHKVPQLNKYVYIHGKRAHQHGPNQRLLRLCWVCSWLRRSRSRPPLNLSA